MKKVKVISSRRITQQDLYMNQLEIDYLLTLLYSSIKSEKDEYEEKYIERLKELTKELETFKRYI